jgi:malonate decarboxylase delta subunit
LVKEIAMQYLNYRYAAPARASGSTRQAIVGVVASGNLEVLVERVLADDICEIAIHTSAEGFDDVWQAVLADFVDRRAPGGLKFSINDGGARPDMVSLRLAQAVRALQGEPS